LLLDIKRIILSKVWEKRTPFKEIVVKKGKLQLVFPLKYLFLQYGKLKHLMKPKVPRVYAGWIGWQVEQKTYVFTYIRGGEALPIFQLLICDQMKGSFN